MSGGVADSTYGARAFGRLGRGIQRHPWWPVIFWILLLVVALPLLPRVGTVTTNSATNLPSSAPSAQAAHEIARYFPNETAPSASFVLLVGPDISGPAGENLTVDVTGRIASDRNLTYLGGVSSLYSAYGGYLGGMTQLANQVISQGSTQGLPDSLNGSAYFEWAPSALFLQIWQGLVANHSSQPASSWNFAAYNQTLNVYRSLPPPWPTLGGGLTFAQYAEAALNASYTGPSGAGFNGTADCAAIPAQAANCLDVTTRAGVGAVLPGLLGNASASELLLDGTVLRLLDVENFSLWPSVRFATSVVLGDPAGLSPNWLNAVWSAWPAAGPSASAATRWAANLANTTPVTKYPLAIPLGIREQFLSNDGTATLVIVTYTQNDGYTTASGATPIFSDVLELDRVVPATIAASGSAASIQYYQTGGAALDQNESTDLSSSLAIVLPLTLLVLVLITIAYFRAPLAPLITFSALGLALGLATAGVVVVGTLVAHVDVTSVELVTTFVLGVRLTENSG